MLVLTPLKNALFATIWLVLIAVLVAVTIFGFSIFGQNTSFPNATFLGKDVARLTKSQIIEVVAEKGYASTGINILHPESGVVLLSRTASEIGFSLESEEIAEHIVSYHRSTSFFVQLSDWFFAKEVVVPFPSPDNRDELYAQFVDDITSAFKDAASTPGEIAIVDGALEIEDPKIGYVVDYNRLQDQIFELFASDNTKKGEAYDIVLLADLEDALVAQAEFNDYVARLELQLNSQVAIELPGEVQVLSTSDRVSLIRPEFSRFDNTWSSGINHDACVAIFDSFATPREALFVVNAEYQVNVEASRDGYDIDSPGVCDELAMVDMMNDYKVKVEVLGDPIEPTLSTQDAEEMNVQHVVAKYTTYHDCCESRTDNIQNMARRVDQTVVQPGEVFGLNDHVGERTSEKGFKPAGTIMFGEMVDTVGGGVSQFATTLFNTAYWSGVPIPASQAHSKYFPRYPEGIEATVSWRWPELQISNDYDFPIVIDTSYTGESISVAILGANDGRIVIGSHKSGKTTITTPNEGGENARIVSSKLSGRFDYKEPRVRYLVYPSMEPGTTRVVEKGKNSWKVTATRSINYQHLDTTVHKEITSQYSYPRVIRIPSCAEVPAEELALVYVSCTVPKI